MLCSMRTLIQGGWVVGHAGGHHQVLRDGVCVVEDDRILHVGKQFDGAVGRDDRRARQARLAGVDHDAPARG